MITKQELLSHRRFQAKHSSQSKYFYELKDGRDGGYYITDNYGDHSYGHHCNVRKVTAKGIQVYTTLAGKSVNAFIPLADLIIYQDSTPAISPGTLVPSEI